jgi:uncharacterized protein (TIGR00251 family)
MSVEYARSHGGGTLLDIEVSPGASRTETAGVNQWRGTVQVRVASEARDGRANDDLLDFLAQALSVPRRDLRIVKGSRSHRKRLYIPLAVDEVKSRLGLV